MIDLVFPLGILTFKVLVAVWAMAERLSLFRGEMSSSPRIRAAGLAGAGFFLAVLFAPNGVAFVSLPIALAPDYIFVAGLLSGLLLAVRLEPLLRASYAKGLTLLGAFPAILATAATLCLACGGYLLTWSRISPAPVGGPDGAMLLMVGSAIFAALFCFGGAQGSSWFAGRSKPHGRAAAGGARPA